MSTKLTGFPHITGQDVYAASITPQTSLGVYMETDDGRGFRYVKNGAVATVAGKVYQGSTEDTTNLAPSGGLSIAAAVKGATQIVLTSSITYATINGLAGGYVSVNVGTGVGQLVRIAGNTAVTGAAGMIITLDDPLLVALDTSSKITIRQSVFNGILVAPATMTNSIVGVAVNVIPASTATVPQYGWIQTHGICSCLETGTGTCGIALGVLQGGTIGSLAPAIAGTPIIAFSCGTVVTGEYGTVFLTIN